MKPIATLLCLVVCSTAIAQEAPQFPEPTEQHKWLEKFVGDWESESKGSMGEGQPEMKCTGSMKSRMLGGFWVVSEMKADMMGTPMNGVQTIGYDVEKKQYIGTWVDSMFGHMWHYKGSVSDDGATLTLEAEGPNFMQPGESTLFRDIYEFKSKDHIVATSQMQTADGEWVTFLVGQVTRKAE